MGCNERGLLHRWPVPAWIRDAAEAVFDCAACPVCRVRIPVRMRRGGSPAPTLVVVDTSAAKLAAGSPVSSSAHVAGGDHAAGRTVSFFDGTTPLGSATTLSGGQASLAVSKLAVGTHSITATYSGDASHPAAVSQPCFEAITGVATVQVVATSGSTSHTLGIAVTVQ